MSLVLELGQKPAIGFSPTDLGGIRTEKWRVVMSIDRSRWYRGGTRTRAAQRSAGNKRWLLGQKGQKPGETRKSKAVCMYEAAQQISRILDLGLNFQEAVGYV